MPTQLTASSRIRVAAPLGRMALTNYLLQSLICMLVFYGFELGRWGLPRAQQVVVVVVVYAAQVAFSHWWLARFRYGPMEWLWRGFTYRQRPRCARVAACGARRLAPLTPRAVNVEDGLGEGLGCFLGQVMPDPAGDDPVGVVYRELLRVGARLRIRLAVGVALEGDRRHGNRGARRRSGSMGRSSTPVGEAGRHR